MRTPLFLFVLGALSIASTCQEPSKTGKMDEAVRGLAHLHMWDPSTEAKGNLSYDIVMGWGKEIVPVLVAHLTDETPTLLYDKTFDITVVLGDICFYLLLKLTETEWKTFFEDGVFVTTLLPNPIFCIRWKEPTLQTRRRVQVHFLKILPPPEDQ
jgi:hypothetical protein